jgi:hypothetical protein
MKMLLQSVLKYSCDRQPSRVSGIKMRAEGLQRSISSLITFRRRIHVGCFESHAVVLEFSRSGHTNACMLIEF